MVLFFDVTNRFKTWPELNRFFRKTCRVQCAIARCTHCSYNVQCHPFLIFYGRLKPRRRRYWIFVVDTLVVVNLELIGSLDTSRYIIISCTYLLIISTRHHWRFEFQLPHSSKCMYYKALYLSKISCSLLNFFRLKNSKWMKKFICYTFCLLKVS